MHIKERYGASQGAFSLTVSSARSILHVPFLNTTLPFQQDGTDPVELFFFGKFSINALTQLLLALIITGYLILVKTKSKSTWMLIGFFAAFTLTLLSNFLLCSMYVPWRHVWGYGQGITLFVGVIALIHVEDEIGYVSRSFR